MTEKICPFCDIENGKLAETAVPNARPGLLVYGALRLLEGMILQENDQFVAMPDVLPVGNGEHILVIPKTHTYSFVAMERNNCSLGDRFAEFTHQVGRTYFPRGFVMFEHGAFKPGEKHQSIFHTHAHIVGTDRDIIDELSSRLRQDGFLPRRVNIDSENYPHNIKNMVNGSGYMFIGQGRHGILVDEGEATVPFPSQFGQRNVHELIRDNENPYWDWKYLLRSGHECEATMKVAVQRAAAIIERQGP